MSKGLVIVESPAKARTINKIVGNNFIVLSSMGHVRDLPEKSLGVDIKNEFEPTYQLNKGRKNIIKELTEAIKNSQEAYLATDPDREGEAISWHLYEILKKQNPQAEFQRVIFHEITKQAVTQSFKHPGKINMDLVNAQQARRVLDRLVGYKVSPLLWKQVHNNAKSAGRVQSVALRLICEREQEINSFVPKEYWNLKAIFAKSLTNETFPAKLHSMNRKKIEINDKDQAERIYEDVKKGLYHIAKITHTPKKRRPGPPFITSTLQQAASTNLRFSAKQTMVIAQQLYEGVDTGSGPTGLITYMRTDSVNIAREAQTAARDFIISAFGEKFLPDKPPVYKSKKTAQEAHEAIRPTDVLFTPAKAKKYLDDKQVKLYQLIWNRFIASQMAPSRYTQHSVDIENNPETCSDNYCFRATSSETTFYGYLKVYNLSDVESEKDDESQVKLPELKVDESCELRKLDSEQKFTEPPSRYSEGTLVRELENNGVGRPSTYASIISTIQGRKYVEKTKGRLIPTSLGNTVCNYLVQNMPKLFEVEFTARMENELDTIEQGKLDWKDMLDTFYANFSQWLEAVKPESNINAEDVLKLMSVFPGDFQWSTPEKKGIRTYDDEKFFNSLKKQLDKGKNLTERQWHALLIMSIRNEERLPNLHHVIDELKLRPLYDQLKSVLDRQSSADTGDAQDNELTLKLCSYLDNVQNWEKSVGRGKRVYDDKKFYSSLSTQARGGRMLSEAQLKALKNLILKYSDQIENFEGIRDELQINVSGSTPNNEKQSEEIRKLLALTQDIKEWSTPSQKGTRKFDEKAFVESLSNQFKQKGGLTNRQLYSLKKVLKNHKDQIPNYETHATELNI